MDLLTSYQLNAHVANNNKKIIIITIMSYNVPLGQLLVV